MAAETKIQWCHHTFNPWRGCTKIHEGCANCYAERDSKRFPKVRGVWGPMGTRVRAADWSEPIRWNAAAEAAGERRRVFCASLADVFEAWDGPIVDHKGGILVSPRPADGRGDPCGGVGRRLRADNDMGNVRPTPSAALVRPALHFQENAHETKQRNPLSRRSPARWLD